MNQDIRLKSLIALGNRLKTLDSYDFSVLKEKVYNENPWFTEPNIQLAIQGIIHFLNEDTLTKWIKDIPLSVKKPKTVALVLAGNIPAVGFHDLLSVLISGHNALIKASSKDSALLNFLISNLISINPDFSKSIIITKETLKGFDAIIATGSDNAARYFHHYFSKYPHIIRANRTSVSILNGNETDNDLKNLGVDVFSYFGLGCRNISKIYIPQNYDINLLKESWNPYAEIIHHHKYANNYNYQQSLLLLNQKKFNDFGYLLLEETERLVSPIAVLYYEYYPSTAHLSSIIQRDHNKIQCIVGLSNLCEIPFGEAQCPNPWDYADQINTLKFLTEL